ncbi:MAG: winged helix-turn-helix domain-containing protein [Jatrophihabitans sp.]
MTSPPEPGQSAQKFRALVVEDDDDIRALVVGLLRQIDFDVLDVNHGRDALNAVADFQPDLVTLDLGLPDLDGVEVCRQIRAQTDAYIIMLTARAEEIDRLIGLEIGADDYITKPFSPRELRARVQAMLRRPRTGAAARPPEPAARADVLPEPEGAETLRLGDLEFDRESRTVLLAGDELELTRTEFDLLDMLLSNPRRVWSRETLLREVWGTEWVSDGHLVEVHMANLRRKLRDDPKQARYVRTVRGVGYRLGPG